MAKVRLYFLGFIIFIFYRLISWTWRLEVHEAPKLRENFEKKVPFILAHFHGDEAPLLLMVPRYHLATMISTSKDGELVNVVYTLLGGKSSRGSSTRGGIGALKGLIELCRSGSNSNISVDGPKGPLHEVKPGVFELSRLMKSEIFVGGVHCESAWRFPRSWNQAFFPKPFAKITVVWDGPVGPINKTDDPRSPELAKALQNQLFAARSRAANLFGARAG